jgi:hypothetical protein
MNFATGCAMSESVAQASAAQLIVKRRLMNGHGGPSLRAVLRAGPFCLVSYLER